MEAEDQIITISYQLVSNSVEKAGKIAEALGERGVDERILPFLAKILSNKMQDIRQTLLRK